MNFTAENLRSPSRHFNLRHDNRAGSIDRFRAREVVNAYACGCFERELEDIGVPLLNGESERFPEAQIEVWTI